MAIAGGLPKYPSELILPFRFGVFFFEGGVIPNPLDIRFQSVSGLNAEVTMDLVSEGGENQKSRKVPKAFEYKGNLILKRGMVVGSPLNLAITRAMENIQHLQCSNVLITLFSKDGIPVFAWLVSGAYPVKWSMSDLDASATNIAIETIELAYTKLRSVRI